MEHHFHRSYLTCFFYLFDNRIGGIRKDIISEEILNFCYLPKVDLGPLTKVITP